MNIRENPLKSELNQSYVCEFNQKMTKNNSEYLFDVSRLDNLLTTVVKKNILS
jgi:hypothetical protein